MESMDNGVNWYDFKEQILAHSVRYDSNVFEYFPHSIPDEDREYSLGQIQLFGDKKIKRILNMYYDDKKTLGKCMEKVLKIKNLKSIGFIEENEEFQNIIKNMLKDSYIKYSFYEDTSPPFEKTLIDYAKEIGGDWDLFFNQEDIKTYLKNAQENIYKDNAIVYPPIESVFNAFSICNNLKEIRVCILGQDPYASVDQAMGLSFSVPDGMPIPSSLQNIFKEIEKEGFQPNKRNGDLTRWANQGIFLINASLTVVEKTPSAHMDYWTEFSKALIKFLSKECKFLVFLLWGNFAKSYAKYIDKRHVILQSAHPSGLSANRGFFGNNHFIECNDALEKKGLNPIDWS